MQPMAESGFRCIAYDQRGCGRSDQAWDGYDLDTLATDLSELLKQLNLTDVTLVGHSMGCGVITRYLAKFGTSGVEKAVYMSPTTSCIIKSHTNPAGIELEMADAAVNFVKKDRAAYTLGLADDFFNLHYPDCQVSSALVNWSQNITMQASSRAAVGLLLAMREDQREELKLINIPVLILHGKADVTPPPKISAIPTHYLLQNSLLKLIEGQPHGMYIIGVNLLIPEITSFINSKH